MFLWTDMLSLFPPTALLCLQRTIYFVSDFLSIGQKWNMKLLLFFLPVHGYNFRLQYIFGNQDSRKHSSQREKAQRFEPDVIPPCIQTA